MGLFRGTYPAIVSGLGLPFMYTPTLALCLPPALRDELPHGAAPDRHAMPPPAPPRHHSANAAALASYAPFSYFFTLTTSREGYGFLVLMHVAVFAASGIVSFVVISLIFRATANELQKNSAFSSSSVGDCSTASSGRRPPEVSPLDRELERRLCTAPPGLGFIR